ncbi:MAG: HEAT repeat domain-containing protein [Desulfovibrionaceae bacterium]|nr:HEAT repeat domain-containing protein [Desulfovibrionaceae bacterium]
MPRFRELKSKVREVLAAAEWPQRLAELEHWPPNQLTGPLFSLLLDPDEDIRWRAAAAFGPTARRLAEGSMEQARVLMRNFMWHMNEESGNLGWGVPESMASAMAAHQGLAREYHSILISYIDAAKGRDGNYLDHDQLRRGAYWGVGRLAQAWPGLARPAARPLMDFGLAESDPANRGLAAWALGLLAAPEALAGLTALAEDTAGLTLFRDNVLESATVGGLALEAASIIREAIASEASADHGRRA